MAVIISPTSPDLSAVACKAKEEGPSSAAVVNQSHGEAHITSRRYDAMAVELCSLRGHSY